MRSLILFLPDDPGSDGTAAWWDVSEEGVIAHGVDADWIARLENVDRTIGLAGPEAVRLDLIPGCDVASAQLRTAARLKAEAAALGPDPHVVISAPPSEADPAWKAVTDASDMNGWIAWGEAHGAALDMIVPFASLMPLDGDWHEARIAGRTILARDGMAIGEDPALVEALVGEDFVDTIDHHQLANLLVAGAANPPVDLRSGRFAMRRRWKPDRRIVKQLAWLTAAIILVAVLIPVGKALRWEAEADRLDRDSAAIATAALGQPVTADAAQARLEVALADRALGPGAAQLIASLLAEIEQEPMIGATLIGVEPAGILTARLSSPDMDSINRLLVALQRRGWNVIANPIDAADGRATVDLTMQGAG
ncbi:type II secretion system protein GspL [Sphingomicrobium sediminis]|uniref:Type II secretion system protein GspL n=1 Tax=Sphingomicrobium sediminis TaxID=2950949 RepID=A0A9X2EJX4_9SPHN|nr:type II secretion system protein GspL [Sphingomicrobium sediminis]MCM8558196.1 type II secretion system protein GspL [Sphingomicrobium sediminis]